MRPVGTNAPTYLSSLRSMSRSLSRVLSLSRSQSRSLSISLCGRSLPQSLLGERGGLSLSKRMSRIGEPRLDGLLFSGGERLPGGGDLCTGDLRIGERGGRGDRGARAGGGERVLSRRLGLSAPPRSRERSRRNPMLLDRRRGTYLPGT